MFKANALRDLAPSTQIQQRMATGAVALAVYVRLAGHPLSLLRAYAWPLALLALINTAVPFFFIAWGQQYIDSGLAAIFNASAPLFTAVFALPIDRTQRVTGARLVFLVPNFKRSSATERRFQSSAGLSGRSDSAICTTSRTNASGFGPNANSIRRSVPKLFVTTG